MFDGRSLAAALMLGAGAIWVGTRFVVAKESEAPYGAKMRYVPLCHEVTSDGKERLLTAT